MHKTVLLPGILVEISNRNIPVENPNTGTTYKINSNSLRGFCKNVPQFRHSQLKLYPPQKTV